MQGTIQTKEILQIKSKSKDPKRTLNAFLICWGQKEWSAMFDFTQVTWKVKNETARLSKMFKDVKLEGYNIVKKTKISDVFYEYQCRLLINGKQFITRINCIKESSAYKPDINGEWGINPVSILRLKEKDETIK